jgi:hypothetical protein
MQATFATEGLRRTAKVREVQRFEIDQSICTETDTGLMTAIHFMANQLTSLVLILASQPECLDRGCV